MRFQGGTSTGKGRVAEQPFERHASRCPARPAPAWPAARCRARSSCRRRRGVIDVGVAMLKQVDARLAGQTVGQGRRRRRRHDGERQRHAAVAMDRQQPLERRRRHRRHRRRATTARPCGRPRAQRAASSERSAQVLMWPTGDAIAPTVAGPPSTSHGGKLRSDGPASARPTASARLCADSVPGGTTATMPRSARASGAVGLLGLALGGEGHQHGAIGAAQRLDHGVVAGLGDRERGVAQQRREVGARRLDDDALPRRRARPGPAPAGSRPPAIARCGRPAPSSAARRWRP